MEKPARPSKICLAAMLFSAIVFIGFLNSASGAPTDVGPCVENSLQPCWDYVALQAGHVEVSPPGNTLESIGYSTTFFGNDTYGLNPAFIADYTHVPSGTANTDIYDAGFAMFGAPGDENQVSQQIGAEVLISGNRRNPEIGRGTLENGYTLGALYRIAIPWSDHIPMELGLRFLHEKLTTQTANGLEGDFVIAPFGAKSPSFVVSYRHDNTEFQMTMIGVRFSFSQ